MNLNIDPEDLDVDVVDIDESHTWKDEVERLQKENAYLRDEASASQLMAALAFKEYGSVRVSKTDIGKGLPGWSLTIDEDGDDLVIGVAKND